VGGDRKLLIRRTSIGESGDLYAAAISETGTKALEGGGQLLFSLLIGGGRLPHRA